MSSHPKWKANCNILFNDELFETTEIKSYKSDDENGGTVAEKLTYLNSISILINTLPKDTTC